MDDAGHPVQAPTDEQLIQRVLSGGDGDAFETLFNRHRRELVAYLYRLSGNASIAEDVSQYAWLKVIETLRARRYRFDTGATFRTFLFTLGRNHFIDEYTRKFDNSRSADLEEAQHMPGPEPLPPEDHARRQEARQVQAALNELPFEQREVIALWADGASIEHMVQVTGAGRETVLSRKKYALTKLRRWFASDDQAAQARAPNTTGGLRGE